MYYDPFLASHVNTQHITSDPPFFSKISAALANLGKLKLIQHPVRNIDFVEFPVSHYSNMTTTMTGDFF